MNEQAEAVRAVEIASKARVVIGLPCHSGHPVGEYVEFLWGAQEVLRQVGAGVDFLPVWRVANLPRARNRIVTRARAAGATHLLMTDDDTAIDPNAIIHMLSHQRDVVCAPYLTKEASPRWTVRLTGAPADHRGLMQASRVSIGMTLISVACLDRLAASVRDYLDKDSGERDADIFGAMIHNDELVHDDHAFSIRWLALGGELWVDPKVTVRHYGVGCWTGSLESQIHKTAEAA